jgi:four helix bundle protein
MTPDELRDRSRQFSMRVVKLYQELPKTTDAQVMGKQVLRSGTSVAANYRASCRARSRAEFVSRMAVVVEEADETCYWLQMIADSGVFPAKKLQPLQKEAQELLKIFSASRNTAEKKNHKSQITKSPMK